MKRTALTLWLCVCAGPAFAFSAQDAATCATLDMAQWDYEVEFFDADDRSEGWKIQSADFGRVATRLGMTRTQLDQTIENGRGTFLKMQKASMFSEDRAAERKLNKLRKICARIIRKAPEMKSHR